MYTKICAEDAFSPGDCLEREGEGEGEVGRDRGRKRDRRHGIFPLRSPSSLLWNTDDDDLINAPAKRRVAAAGIVGPCCDRRLVLRRYGVGAPDGARSLEPKMAALHDQDPLPDRVHRPICEFGHHHSVLRSPLTPCDQSAGYIAVAATLYHKTMMIHTSL